MRNIKLAQKHIARQKTVPCTASLENVEAVSDSAVRVVARLNKMPESYEELAQVLESKLGNLVHLVPGSAAIYSREVSGMVVSAFAAKQPTVRSAFDIDENMREVASNVYMDDRDRSVWTKQGAHLVRKDQDDIAEVASVAKKHLRQANQMRPIEALAKVQSEFAGAGNTEAMTFFDTKSNKVQFGVRVGEDHVFSAEAGLCEVAQNLVIHSAQLFGQDNPNRAEVASLNDAGYDIDRTVQYYERLYGDDGDFWTQLEDQIRDKAMV